MDSPDTRNVEHLWGMESMRLLMRSWDILSHSSRRDPFPLLGRVCESGRRSATRLPRMSQTSSIGFMSGEHIPFV
ncbi:hypothetical protein TNCV_3806401 [Trichonephila clavipes]|nr:hypothetical protein TNCV_3806401 [Trichonephila clavipes]